MPAGVPPAPEALRKLRYSALRSPVLAATRWLRTRFHLVVVLVSSHASCKRMPFQLMPWSPPSKSSRMTIFPRTSLSAGTCVPRQM
jgi:hypothetical protein